MPELVGREREYLAPQGVDYRGEFRPELAQLLTKAQANSREQRKSLTPEELADLLRSQRAPKPRDGEDDGDEQDPQTSQMVQNLMKELDQRDPRMQSVTRRPSPSNDDDSGPLSATQPNTFIYDEWDAAAHKYRERWCKVYEKNLGSGDLTFYRETLLSHAGLLQQIRREFEQVVPELYHKEKRLPEGSDHDLDLAIEALTDFRIGISPSEKIFWRHHKIERDVAVAFLLDMSGSTGEAIKTVSDKPLPRQRARRGAFAAAHHRRRKRGDRSDDGLSRSDRRPLRRLRFFRPWPRQCRVLRDQGYRRSVFRSTSPNASAASVRSTPRAWVRRSAIRRQSCASSRRHSKFLFLISDGRPQDRGYSQEGAEKAHAVQDTRMAMIEARREGIHPFCLTVDKDGNDYLRTMMDDFSYEVLADVSLLPRRLPQLYKKLTT